MQPFDKKPTGIVVHHSLTKDGITKSWDAIRRYHIEVNGWDDIGYHFGCELVNDAVVTFTGRDPEYKGAHCPPNDTIGYLIVGNYDIDTPTTSHILVAARDVARLLRKYGLTPDDVYRHHDVDIINIPPKSCPGKFFPWRAFMTEVRGIYAATAETITETKSEPIGARNSPERKHNMWQFIIARLKEPTTWAGLITLVTAAGVQVSPEQSDAIIAFGIALAGIVTVFMPEGKNAK